MIHVEEFLKSYPNKAFNYNEIAKATGLSKNAVKRQIKKLWKSTKIVKLKRMEFRTSGDRTRKVPIAYFMWNEKRKIALVKPKMGNRVE